MLKRIFSASLLVAMLVGLTSPALVTNVAALGDKGTLKIVNEGSMPGTPSNEPKVCIFEVEGFGFEPNKSGTLEFTVQGNDQPTGLGTGPFAFGPTNTDGYATTDEDFALEEGHYKVTLYGAKKAGAEITKLKSKVFKLECAESQPEGKSHYKLKCELLKLKAPKNIQPEEASYQYYLNGQPVALGNHDLPAGEYTLTLKVNNVLVDTDVITIEACDDGEVLTPDTSVAVVCPVDGLNVELTFTNTGTAASNVTVNGTPYVVAAGATVVATVPKAAVVNLTIVIDGEPAEPTTVTCPTGGSGGNGETPTTPTTPVTVIVNGGGAAEEIVSLPVTSGSSDKIASIVAMISAVLATIGGYVVRMRYAAQL